MLIDKSSWGPGPWQTEPDLKVWRHRGVYCVVCRDHNIGNFEVHVGVDSHHPWYGTQGPRVVNHIRRPVHSSRLPDVSYRSVFINDYWYLGCDFGRNGEYSPGWSYDRENTDPATYSTLATVIDAVEILAEEALSLYPAAACAAFGPAPRLRLTFDGETFYAEAGAESERLDETGSHLVRCHNIDPEEPPRWLCLDWVQDHCSSPTIRAAAEADAEVPNQIISYA